MIKTNAAIDEQELKAKTRKNSAEKTGGNMIKRKSSRAIVIIALVCALLVSSALFISGCGGNNSDNSYTIVYDSQGGAAVKNGTYTVDGSNKFYLPTPSIGSDPKMYG